MSGRDECTNRADPTLDGVELTGLARRRLSAVGVASVSPVHVGPRPVAAQQLLDQREPHIVGEDLRLGRVAGTAQQRAVHRGTCWRWKAQDSSADITPTRDARPSASTIPPTNSRASSSRRDQTTSGGRVGSGPAQRASLGLSGRKSFRRAAPMAPSGATAVVRAIATPAMLTRTRRSSARPDSITRTPPPCDRCPRRRVRGPRRPPARGHRSSATRSPNGRPVASSACAA